MFINGHHIGGCDDTIVAYTKGTLPPLLLEREQLKDNYTKDNIFGFDLIVIGGGSGGLACAKVSGIIQLIILSVCIIIYSGTPLYCGHHWDRS